MGKLNEKEVEAHRTKKCLEDTFKEERWLHLCKLNSEECHVQRAEKRSEELRGELNEANDLIEFAKSLLEDRREELEIKNRVLDSLVRPPRLSERVVRIAPWLPPGKVN